MKTKPFNLEEALAGKPVIDTYRNNEEASQLHVFVYTNCASKLFYMCGDSVFNVSIHDTSHLRMKCKTKKIEGWVNVYPDRFSSSWEKESIAKNYANGDCLGQHFISIEIEV